MENWNSKSETRAQKKDANAPAKIAKGMRGKL